MKFKERRVVSAWYDEADPFNYFEGGFLATRDAQELQSNDVLFIWGGEDIAPSIYKQSPCSFVYAGPSPSARDKCEMSFIRKAVELNVPIIGVCRGAQLLCAMNGGSLFQHVTGHRGNHAIKTFDGKELVTNSIHHQMLNLDKTKHKLIAWSKTRQSKCYLVENDVDVKDVVVEPEIVFFPEIRALAIQGHPEYLYATNPFVEYCRDKAEEFL